MKYTQKGFIVPLIITIIAILGIAGVLVYENNKAEAPVISVENVATTTDIAKDSNVYTNTKYGFTLNFPDSWKGFVVKDGDNVIRFCVNNPKRLEGSMPGYSCLYQIIITDRQQWEKDAAPCIKDPESRAMCDWVNRVVDKNDKYVYSGTIGVQDSIPEEDIYIADAAKISFKFIDTTK